MVSYFIYLYIRTYTMIRMCKQQVKFYLAAKFLNFLLNCLLHISFYFESLMPEFTLT